MLRTVDPTMNKIVHGLIGAGLLTAALTAALAPAATAAAPAPTQDTRLQLTADRIAEDGVHNIGFVWLDCPASDRPAHPHRAEACAALDAVDGDFDRLNAEPGAICTAEYSPVTLTARGTYKGRTVDWTRTYGNNCEATRLTGSVFYF